ncbi:hypothetical protein TNCV_1568771 [Trichonephila clavipes]|nr:hypothetical protein TNCV_1568771 [Trichonephila clavipes]
MTRAAPEQATPLLTPTPTEGHLSRDIFNPLTGYLPPEKLFRKRLTLILRFPSKMQQTFSFPLLELGRSNGENFTTQFGRFENYTRAFGDGPRNFEPWSSDVDDIIPSPNYPTTPTGGRFSSRQI